MIVMFSLALINLTYGINNLLFCLIPKTNIIKIERLPKIMKSSSKPFFVLLPDI